jgi:hypothetical protein
MQKKYFILNNFLLLFVCLSACQVDKKQSVAPCAVHDFNIENINPLDSNNTCEINGLCQGKIDSIIFDGKVMAALSGDTLLMLNLIAKHENYDYSSISFSIDLRSNKLIDSTFYIQIKRNKISSSSMPIYKIAKGNKSLDDCFQYDKQQQIMSGYISKRKFEVSNPNTQTPINKIYLPELYFKTNTKTLKNPCITCG